MNELPVNQVVCGDCLEEMKELPRSSVDLVITDPPYNILVSSMDVKRDEWMKFSNGGPIIRTQHEWDEIDNYRVWTESWLRESSRVLKEDCNLATFIAAQYITVVADVLKDEGFEWKNQFCWVKNNPVPHLRKVNFAFGIENVVWMSRGKNVFNWDEGHQPNYLIHSLIPSGHPTQKPLELVEILVKYLSREGQVVLDPFCGSGTTLIAAQKLGRKWIGIDISSDYVEMAKKRISSECSHKLEEYM